MSENTDERKRYIDETVEKNLGLVHHCANRFKGKGIEYDDLYQAGCMGLLKAARGFDESRGVMFSTYAVPVILGEIKRLFREGGSIKVSRTIKELSLKLNRANEAYIKEHGVEPTIGELALFCGCTRAQAAQALEVSKPPVYIFEENESGTYLEIPVESPENEISDSLALRQIFKELDEADQKMLYLRYFKNLTQSKTAMLMNMTQVQVSRREKKLLTMLRVQMLK
ncbi:MAG: sigma-70 family RNA polymerase sigma factor [Oscillospiraceae bacterium]|nr:sigma-70 family RNA polymerase sigma factor [Oscillospiraceae bacterium]